MPIHLIATRTLREFWKRHAIAEESLRAWARVIETGSFRMPKDVLATFPNARSIGNSRFIFNIQGNQYRLIVVFHFDAGRCYVRFVGTDAEYDDVDATTI